MRAAEKGGAYVAIRVVFFFLGVDEAKHRHPEFLLHRVQGLVLRVASGGGRDRYSSELRDFFGSQLQGLQVGWGPK